MLIFVAGGARSGKSSFAERLLTESCSKGHLHYIATSLRSDQEMSERILHHQLSRGDIWTTWEQPTSLALLMQHFSPEDYLLVDCLTILTANELFQYGYQQNPIEVYEKILNDIQKLSFVKRLVIVSNDIFSGGVPEDKGTFTYMKLLGSLHQELVRRANCTYRVINGIAQVK